MVQPYRAQVANSDGTWRDGVVVDTFTLRAPDQTVRMAVVAFPDGSMTELPESHLRCIEPTYLGAPEEPEADHAHDFGGKGVPILEGSRLAGMRFACQVEGCGASWSAPAAAGR